ncbi:PLP-dependent aminotransferase family protein [Vineibacter terrae]|uniref:PLP-dependent aminotransferase family protein n=1 Tax=Vineibacter terrae TaxID=2586908 RepID=A0A5C8P6M3_9HYPH|nr:PLP-dependent aminotransferase family protein [Vineibacter terrae]TXL69335.1 PLP-dependent aminotransferase family protein [Vineibacter terrae]
MVKGSRATIELIEIPGQPVFIRLATAITRDIERGRLKPGDALPGTRALAKVLRIHRNTVDAAYHELTMQGWLVAEASRGTFVARDLPVLATAAASLPPAVRQAAARTGTPPPLLRFSDGVPDPRLLPHAELARAFRRSLSTPAFLASDGSDDPLGSTALRAALAGYLSQERGLALCEDDIIVTRGSQMALFLAASAILAPGQAIAVEEPGYPLAWRAFRAAGARVIGVPVGAHGLDVERLAAVLAHEPALKAVYVTPHHHYPTTVTLGAGHRLKLIELAHRHGLAIIEDDYDHEYRFEGRPVLPLAARAAAATSVVFVGSLSKLLAPGIRLGYAVAQAGVLQRMAARREAIDRQGDLPLEQAVAALLRDGELGRHARKARRIYHARRDHLAAELRRHLAAELAFDVPAGGLAIWARARGGIDAAAWSTAARRAGLEVRPGAAFCLDESAAPQAFRLGFANLNEPEISRAVKMLKRTRPAAAR